jgi:hypothetical protein
LFSAPCILEPNIDWQQVLSESVMQTVVLTAFQKYKELPLDEKMSNLVQKNIKQCTKNNLFCFQGHRYLHGLMTQNGIPYCIIKGAASAYRYPDPLLRIMGDVDFYVPNDKVEQALALLLAEGFQKVPGNHSYHYALQKDGMHLELHYRPIAIPDGEMSAVFYEYWSDIFEKSILTNDGLGQYVFPSDFHHGFILLTHLQSHLLAGGVGLRHVCDWAVFANAFSNDEFVALFASKLKRVGLWRLAQALSLASVEYMGMERREWMGDDFATAQALLADILCGGNFGRKDKQRTYEGLFISDNFTAGTSKNRFVQLVHSMNRMVDYNWNFAKKMPLLYPVGWLLLTARFFFRVITGKRRLNLISTLEKSRERKALYHRLALFEAETDD